MAPEQIRHGSNQTRSRYVAAESFVLRTPILPARFRPSADGDLLPSDPEVDAIVREAIEVSAPGFDVDRALKHVPDEPAKQAKRRERQRRTLHRYITRMSTRPTPFGSMAAVSAHRLGGSGEILRVGSPAEATLALRPDMGYLHQLTSELLGSDDATARTTWRWNTAATIGGGRVILPELRSNVDDKLQSARVRPTAPLHAVREFATTNRHRDEIVAVLQTQFPGASDKIGGFVNELIRHKFLLPAILPPVLATSSSFLEFTSLLDEYSGVGEPAGNVIREVTHTTPIGRSTIEHHRARLAHMTEDGLGETVEVHASRTGSTSGGLPAAVAEKVSDAAGFLLRISAGAGAGATENERPLQHYHARFLERYGLNTAVPVGLVLDEAAGIGMPEHYQAKFDPSHYFTRTGKLSDYERVLLDLITEAHQTRQPVVEVTEDVENRLLGALPELNHRAPYPSVDVFAQLGWDGADWRIVLNSLPVARGGASSARFLHTLPPEHVENLKSASFGGRLERDGILVAEVGYVPSSGKAANVAVRPPIVANYIPLNVPTASGVDVLDLADVHVVGSTERLHLWSRAHEQELVVTEHHLLSHGGAPAVLRLLVEISDWQFTPLGGFAWGPFEENRRLPRVQRHGVVLRSAEWTLLPTDVPHLNTDTGSPMADSRVRAQLNAWREQWEVPREVYLVFADQRLLIDLSSTWGQDEVLGELRKSAHLRFQEFLPNDNESWLTDTNGDAYLSEVVVPVTFAGPISLPIKHELPHYYRAQDVRYPGSDWLYVELFCPPETQQELIGSFRTMVQEGSGADVAPTWFFIRYQDRGHHLRLRVRASSPDESGDLFLRVSRWSTAAIEAGLASAYEFRPYRPELGRYGGPTLMPTAESLFHRESELVSEVLSSQPKAADDPHIRLTAVALLDFVSKHWGSSLDERLALATSLSAHKNATPIAADWFRPHREELVGSVLDNELEALPSALAESSLLPALALAYESLSTAAAHASNETLDRSPILLPSLLHMLMNRLLEPGKLHEYDVYELWRLSLQAARGYLARPREER